MDFLEKSPQKNTFKKSMSKASYLRLTFLVLFL